MFDYVRDNLRFLQQNFRRIGGGFLLTLLPPHAEQFDTAPLKQIRGKLRFIATAFAALNLSIGCWRS